MALICHCEALNERKINRVIARGARTLADVQAACGAGVRCGGCIPAIEELLADAGCTSGIAPVRVLTHAG